jgi:ParB-like chromosome segregation protein Spo0J
MELKEIPLKKIDLDDDTFRIHRPGVQNSLLSSVENTGVVNPPWLQSLGKSGRYRVVMGFRRISALKSLGHDSVTANVVTETDYDEKRLLEIAILDNLSHGPLDPVEISRALIRLKHMDFQVDEIQERYLPLMGLKSDRSTLDRYLFLDTLPYDILESVSNDEIKLTSIDRAKRSFDGKELEDLLRLIRDLKLGVNRQRELITLLDELMKRDRIDLSNILDAEEISAILTDEDPNLPQKAQALISHLRERRFPQATEMINRVRERIRELGLNPAVSLEVSSYLEERLMRISFGFGTNEEYRKVLENLTDAGDGGEIEKILADFFGEGGLDKRR